MEIFEILIVAVFFAGLLFSFFSFLIEEWCWSYLGGIFLIVLVLTTLLWINYNHLQISEKIYENHQIYVIGDITKENIKVIDPETYQIYAVENSYWEYDEKKSINPKPKFHKILNTGWGQDHYSYRLIFNEPPTLNQ